MENDKNTNTKNDKKTILFEETPVPKAVMTLAVPTVIGCLVMILYNLADTYFVGMLNDPVETAAVTLGATVILAFNAVTNLFGVGSSSLMSRALGVKDYDTFKRTSAFGFYCALAASLLFSALVAIFNTPLLNLLGAAADNIEATRSYIFWTVICGAVPAIINVVMGNLVRSEGSALHASIGTMSGCLLNIILDPFFILPQFLNMGAAGAGLATCISNCVACIYFFVLLKVKKGRTYVSISIKDFRPSKYIVKEVVLVGVPASIQNLLNVTGMTVMNNSMSAFGSEAVSAMGIAHKTTMIPMYVSMGLTQGVMPLIGYNFASKNKKRMSSAIKFTLGIGTVFMVIATFFFFVFAKPIIMLFMDNELIVEYGAAFIKGLCLAQPFLAIDFSGVAVFQACGMGEKSLVFAILRKIVFEIPALIVLNKLFPMYGAAYAQLVAEVVLAVAAVLMLRKIMRGNKKSPSRNERKVHRQRTAL